MRKQRERHMFCTFQKSGELVRLAPRGDSVQQKVCRLLQQHKRGIANPWVKWDLALSQAIDEFGLERATALWQGEKVEMLFPARRYFQMLGQPDLHVYL